MSWIEIMPTFEAAFCERGWASAEAMLRVPGVVVNRHRTRHVEQICVEDGHGETHRFYIKKDRWVTWRDRFRNAWHGFGWCANAVREAATLQALAKHGIACPQVVALGEADREAFVVTRDESNKVDLRDWLRDACDIVCRSALADSLGAMLAKTHDAGFAHPDLFGKHVLVGPDACDNPICILDWQRTRHSPVLGWHTRRRDLARLDATLHESLASDRLRMRCLRAYRNALTDRACCPPLPRLAEQIRHESDRLRGRRQIREARQLAIPGCDQQFVSMRDGRLLVVRSFHDDKKGRLPAWLLSWPDSDTEIQLTDLDDSQRVWIESASEKRGVDWQLPELAHKLFRLQRFHVPGVRLLAAARSAERVRLLTKSPATISLSQALQSASMDRCAELSRQADDLIEKISAAGLGIDTPDSWWDILGVTEGTGQVILDHPDRLIRDFTPWRAIAATQSTMQE